MKTFVHSQEGPSETEAMRGPRKLEDAKHELDADGVGFSAAFGTSSVPRVIDEVLDSPGQTLNPQVRGMMEPLFGMDFGGVKLHTGAGAARSTKAVDAAAFTLGEHVVVAPQYYAPSTFEGFSLLAHELAHFVQQQASAQPRSAADVTMAQPEHPVEREARGAAVAAASGLPPQIRTESAPVIARQTEEESAGNSAQDSWWNLAKGAWNVITHNALSGGVDLASKAIGSGSGAPAALTRAVGPLGRAGKIGGPLGIASNLLGMYDALSRPGYAFENKLTRFGDLAASVAGLGSSVIGTGAMLSSAITGSAGAWGAGTAGSGIFGASSGLFATGAAAPASLGLGSVGAVLGAGAGGYALGRTIDDVAGWAGGKVMPSVLGALGGEETAKLAQKQNWSLSALGGDMASHSDLLLVKAMQRLGWKDKDKPASSQTFGRWLADLTTETTYA